MLLLMITCQSISWPNKSKLDMWISFGEIKISYRFWTSLSEDQGYAYPDGPLVLSRNECLIELGQVTNEISSNIN